MIRVLVAALALLAASSCALARQAPAGLRAPPTRPGAVFGQIEWPTARLYGDDYVDLAVVARKLGFKFALAGRKATLSDAGGTRCVFEDIERDFHLDGIRVHMSKPVVASADSLWITKQDAEKTVLPLFRPADLAAQLPVGAPRLIVLDPGHGGTDPGTENAKARISEKTAALDVALRVRKLLEARGYRVKMTREKDTRFSGNPRVDLPMRAAFANKALADLFVSIHFNNAPESIKGVETYTLTPQHMLSTASTAPDDDTPRALPGNRYDHANLLLGFAVHRAMMRGLETPDRGYKRARWAVLRTLACPGVLVECAYLSNDEEARRVAKPEFRQQIAESIAAGVVAYSEQLEKLRPEPKK
ncbi:MAG: N-acetylmuramoyl-L-alanine amidase [Opitutae bacterium]|nr:N-acetylmuramoyl-L-alanine amidase [Opitutae bacterium]